MSLKVKQKSPKKARDKDGQKKFVQDVRLKDSNGDEINYALWEHMISRFDREEGEVVLFRSVRYIYNEIYPKLVSTGDTQFLTDNIENFKTLFV